jgi:hypothetical protein
LIKTIGPRVDLSGTPSFRTPFLKFLEEVLDLYKVLAGNGLGGRLRERSMERAPRATLEQVTEASASSIGYLGYSQGAKLGTVPRLPDNGSRETHGFPVGVGKGDQEDLEPLSRGRGGPGFHAQHDSVNVRICRDPLPYELLQRILVFLLSEREGADLATVLAEEFHLGDHALAVSNDLAGVFIEELHFRGDWLLCDHG